MKQENHTIPTILIVLGATGDLMAKKIAPALFSLFEKKMLPPHFALLGVSRRDWNDGDLREHIRAILAVKAPHASPGAIDEFLKMVAYQKVTFDEFDDYQGLSGRLKQIDDAWGVCANKLFYLSVPPQFYDLILTNIHRAHLADGCSPEEGWTRIIVEKPFGSDERTAKTLDAKLARLFKEEQIYRVDHYLAKEMLQNILFFRFANDLFEDEWNARTVEMIRVRLFEKIGVEDRGAFYDEVGALQDVGQNHLLQMLALATMDRPERYDAAAVRPKRAALIEALTIPTVKEAAAHSFRAQYEGYRGVKGVKPGSKTETYFRVEGGIENHRWEGVPFVLESGKRLGEALKEIEITLRHVQPCLCGDGEHHKNTVTIHLEPKERITVRFYAKKPGHERALEERVLAFDFRESEHHAQYTEEYEKLLLDCIAGDQTLFVSSEEVAAMWRFIDPFADAWKKDLVPLASYTPDTRTIVAEADAVMTAARGQADRALVREVGVFGLGKMGDGVARQLKEKGWRVVVANRSEGPAKALETEGFEAAYSHEELAAKLSGPRILWTMITAGKGVDDFFFGKDGVIKHLRRGDVVIDAGNSFFEDTVRRAKQFKKKGIIYMDVGFSGGPAGARHGGSLMIGGDKKTFERLEPLFRDLAVPDGYEYFGAAGAGHFVKMVHNGIEYGMMQSLAEGFALMKRSPFKLDLTQVASIYNRGSVIESRLVGWLEDAFRAYGEELKPVSGSVAATGEGEWTIKTGKKWRMKLPAIEDAFRFRQRSKKSPSYIGKVLSALRNRFGGHSIK